MNFISRTCFVELSSVSCIWIESVWYSINAWLIKRTIRVLFFFFFFISYYFREALCFIDAEWVWRVENVKSTETGRCLQSCSEELIIELIKLTNNSSIIMSVERVRYERTMYRARTHTNTLTNGTDWGLVLW